MWVDPNTVNAINTLLGGMLACLMMAFWSRGGRKASSLLWTAAAWCFAISYGSYFSRIWASYEISSFVAACATTMGMGLLLLGMEVFMQRAPSWRSGLCILGCHGVAMACIIALDASTEGRMMLNSFFWGGVASATFLCIRQGAPTNWREWYAFPSLVIGLHALFHLLRFLVAAGNVSGLIRFDLPTLQSISFSEASLFTVALFMSLLIADLQLRNRELQSAIDEVQALSGLLPICSSCKKIRDDAGYWTKLETYISQRSGAQFSHGFCPDCAMRMYPEVFADTQSRAKPQVVRVESNADLAPR